MPLCWSSPSPTGAEVDFVTSLPLCDGYTTIVTIMDHFSKDVQLIPLVKLPSDFETSNPPCVQDSRSPRRHHLQLRAPITIPGLAVVWQGAGHQLQPLLVILVVSPSMDRVFVQFPDLFCHCGDSVHGLYGFQSPLLSAQVGAVAVPSVQAHISRCREVWRETQNVLKKLPSQPTFGGLPSRSTPHSTSPGLHLQIQITYSSS